MIGYIYKITSPSNKIYIGKTSDLKTRESYYKRLKCKNQKFLYNSIKKYGWENHIFEILQECKLEELNDLEVFYISKFNSFYLYNPLGMNLTLGGEGTLGFKHSEETKSLISKHNRDKYKKGFIPEFFRDVIDIETGVYFSSIKEACSSYGIEYTYGFNMLTNKKYNRTNLRICDNINEPTRNRRKNNFKIKSRITGEIFQSVYDLIRKTGISEHTVRYNLNRNNREFEYCYITYENIINEENK